MSQQELDLLQLSPGGLAKFRACAPKIMGSELFDADSLRACPHHMPDCLFCHAAAPNAAHLVHLPKNPPLLDSCRCEPGVQFLDNPVGDGNSAHMSAFAQKIDNRPVVLPLLDMVQGQTDGLMPSQAAGQEQGQQSAVPLALHAVVVGCLPKSVALF